MIKRLLEKNFFKQIIGLLIAILCICFSMVGASNISITKDTPILTALLAFLFILIFLVGLLSFSFILADVHDQRIKRKNEKI